MRQRTNRGIIGPLNRVTLASGSGIHSLADSQQHQGASLWPKPGINATYVVVAGGGGGGGGEQQNGRGGGGAGGGAGGLLTNNIILYPGTTYTVIVGAGGAGGASATGDLIHI
jgi:hypothetical protein